MGQPEGRHLTVVKLHSEAVSALRSKMPSPTPIKICFCFGTFVTRTLDELISLCLSSLSVSLSIVLPFFNSCLRNKPRTKKWKKVLFLLFARPSGKLSWFLLFLFGSKSIEFTGKTKKRKKEKQKTKTKKQNGMFS